jgi:hypothetical protein
MGVKPSKLTVAGAAQGLHLFPVSPFPWTHGRGTPNAKQITFAGKNYSMGSNWLGGPGRGII